MTRIGPGALPSTEQLALITKVARLYHEQGLRQPAIADKLHLSQSRVSRLLKEAVAAGIVRTVVVPPEGVHPDLEDDVKRLFGLDDVVVADPSDDDDASVLNALGAAAAVYLETSLTGGERVGLSSWSATLLATVDAMSPKTVRTATEIVQVIGGVGAPGVQVMATRLTDRLARVTGAVPRYLAAPGVVSSRSGRDALLDDPFVAEVAALWNDLSVVLVGIGSVQPSPLLRNSGNSLSEHETGVLRDAGAVGDICLRFFDDRGQVIDSDLHERVLGISTEQLFDVPRRVGVAGGERKFEAIRAALRGGWLSVLVTDVATARRLLADA